MRRHLSAVIYVYYGTRIVEALSGPHVLKIPRQRDTDLRLNPSSAP